MPKSKLTGQEVRRAELSQAAARDLEEIWSYLNAENAQAADSLITEFLQKFRMLAEHPNLGKLRAELFLELRSFPLKKYLIF